MGILIPCNTASYHLKSCVVKSIDWSHHGARGENGTISAHQHDYPDCNLGCLHCLVIVAVTVIIPTLDDIESNTDTLNEDKSAGKEFRRITKEIKELDDDFAWLAGVLANALDYDFSNLTIALHNDFHNYLNGAAGLLASIDNGVAQVAANTA